MDNNININGIVAAQDCSKSCVDLYMSIYTIWEVEVGLYLSTKS